MGAVGGPLIHAAYKRNLLEDRHFGPGLPIELRGNSPRKEVKPPPAFGLAVGKFSLTANTIGSDFCPTGRDGYLRYVAKPPGTPATESWPQFQGDIADRVYPSLYNELRRHCGKVKPENLDLSKVGKRFATKFIKAVEAEFASKSGAFLDKPKQSEVDKFLNQLRAIIKHETALAHAMMAKALAEKPQMNISQEFDALLPLAFKRRFNGRAIGLSDANEPDFVLGNRVGDVKWGPPNDNNKLIVALYALAMEADSSGPAEVNEGYVINPQFKHSTGTPEYDASLVPFAIDDNLRRQALLKRDAFLEMLTSKKDPGLPASIQAPCHFCRYKGACWP